MLLDDFIEKAKISNGELINWVRFKNDNYNFDEKLKKTVKIYCNSCKEYHTSVQPSQLIKGYGCPSHSIKTIEFIKKAKSKYGDVYEYITDRNNKEYWGTGITTLTSENCKIGVMCKKHGNIFETHVKGFLDGSELCPICKFEKSKFLIGKRDNSNYNKTENIYIHNECKDNGNINHIIDYLKKHTNVFGFFEHNLYVNDDLTLDIEMCNLNDLNKDWRGLSICIDEEKIPSFINFGYIITSCVWVYGGLIENGVIAQKVNYIENLCGMPKKLYGDLGCVNTNLKSIIGSPIEIYGNFTVKNNNIETLEGCPKIIHGDFDISNNVIKSIKDFYDVDCEVFGKLNRKNNLFVE